MQSLKKELQQNPGNVYVRYLVLVLNMKQDFFFLNGETREIKFSFNFGDGRSTLLLWVYTAEFSQLPSYALHFLKVM